jgi:hypothetical protein
LHHDNGYKFFKNIWYFNTKTLHFYLPKKKLRKFNIQCYFLKEGLNPEGGPCFAEPLERILCAFYTNRKVTRRKKYKLVISSGFFRDVVDGKVQYYELKKGQFEFEYPSSAKVDRLKYGPLNNVLRSVPAHFSHVCKTYDSGGTNVKELMKAWHANEMDAKRLLYEIDHDDMTDHGNEKDENANKKRKRQDDSDDSDLD